jgi:hypothetical protein
MKVIVERLRPGTTCVEWLSDWAYGTRTRAQAFATVVKYAEDSLRHSLPPRPNESDQWDIYACYSWTNSLFEVLCLPHVQNLISALQNVGYRDSRFIFSFNRCSFLHARSAAYWFSEGNILAALQRIIKSHDLFEIEIGKFNIWYTFLDTNSKITAYLPPGSKEPSSARSTSLMSLPPWSFLSCDLVPEVSPPCPAEALYCT